MNYFTKQNAPGYTEQEIEKLNRIMAEKIELMDEADIWNEAELKYIAAKLLIEFK